MTGCWWEMGCDWWVRDRGGLSSNLEAAMKIEIEIELTGADPMPPGTTDGGGVKLRKFTGCGVWDLCVPWSATFRATRSAMLPSTSNQRARSRRTDVSQVAAYSQQY
jgi:hypothetical protein